MSQPPPNPQFPKSSTQAAVLSLWTISPSHDNKDQKSKSKTYTRLK